MVDTTHNNPHLLNQINGKITSSGVIDQQKINPHDLSYQRYKDDTDFLFFKLRIRDSRYEPYISCKKKIIIMSNPN